MESGDRVRLFAGHRHVTRDVGLRIEHPEFAKQFQVSHMSGFPCVTVATPDSDMCLILPVSALREMVAFYDEVSGV